MYHCFHIDSRERARAGQEGLFGGTQLAHHLNRQGNPRQGQREAQQVGGCRTHRSNSQRTGGYPRK